MNEPKEDNPPVENPRACLEGMFAHHPTSEPPWRDAMRLKANVKNVHDHAVIRALDLFRQVLEAVKNTAPCNTSTPPVEGCFPNCMSEGARNLWIAGTEALQAERVARDRKREAGVP